MLSVVSISRGRIKQSLAIGSAASSCPSESSSADSDSGEPLLLPSQTSYINPFDRFRLLPYGAGTHVGFCYRISRLIRTAICKSKGTLQQTLVRSSGHRCVRINYSHFECAIFIEWSRTMGVERRRDPGRTNRPQPRVERRFCGRKNFSIKRTNHPSGASFSPPRRAEIFIASSAIRV